METTHHFKPNLTSKIMIAMILGIAVGVLLYNITLPTAITELLIDGVLDLGGKIFITILKMLVVPIVFVSLVCGTCKLGMGRRFGVMALKTLGLYLITTAIAISIALLLSVITQVGTGANNTPTTVAMSIPEAPALKETIIAIFPDNPVAALASGNMLQIIFFAILFGTAITMAEEKGEKIREFFFDLDVIIMRMMSMVIALAPYGVFCLVSAIFSKLGFGLIFQLIGYFSVVLLSLFVHLMLTYSLFLYVFGGLNPFPFYRKIIPAMLFAFSTSSSSASIPVVLDTVERRLGVKNSIASFVIPLGATINMDGTAIMQGVATVFIAHLYNVSLGIGAYLTVILTATLASIGTAAVPSIGLITLTLVLQQVGLPIEGITLILGVDRLLDMTRTAVNVAGDSMVACVVAKSEGEIELPCYNSVDATSESYLSN